MKRNYIHADLEGTAALKKENADILFPSTLDSFTECKQLGGGTGSVFAIHTPENPNALFVLKFGSHVNALKLEILHNAIYKVLGVVVPPMRTYRHIPLELAKVFNLSGDDHFYKVSPYIAENKRLSAEEKTKLIKATAKKQFVAHAFLGNIDIAKEDNYIIDTQDNVYMVDAGANFLFRALGDYRNNDPDVVSEIDSLRNCDINKVGEQWFTELSNEDLNKQLQAIHVKIRQIEETVWKLTTELEFQLNYGLSI